MRRAALWDLAVRRALEWSQYWTRYRSPHVRAGANEVGRPRPANRREALTRTLHAPQVVELGEDMLCLIMSARLEEIQSLASTCRCLRGLLLPRLLEQKARAVRAIYLAHFV